MSVAQILELPRLRELTPVAATPESLEGYGWLIGEPGGVDRDKIDFYGKVVRVTQPAKFSGNDDLCLNLVTFQPRAPNVQWMEFHTKHTQTFIPLSGKPFYMFSASRPVAAQTGAGTKASRASQTLTT